MKKYSTPAYIDNESGVTEFGSVDVYLASEVDARIAELEKALRLIAEHKGKALLGDGRYDEGANAAFNQMADIAASVL